MTDKGVFILVYKIESNKRAVALVFSGPSAPCIAAAETIAMSTGRNDLPGVLGAP
jgi:hypothetical protein